MGEAYHMVYQRLITWGGAYHGVGLIEGWGLSHGSGLIQG